MQLPTFDHEQSLITKGYAFVAGVDEAGAGCWAGPVVAGAVLLRAPINSPLIRDSKTLSASQRKEARALIEAQALAWSIGSASPEEIDELNIRQADFLAMRRAIAGLSPSPSYVLADGFLIPNLSMPCERLVRGDALSQAIACASILAKTTRDALMEEHDARYPEYGFAKHKGYGTAIHERAINTHGLTPLHRKTYAPCKRFL